jgi:hypothetical protein
VRTSQISSGVTGMRFSGGLEGQPIRHVSLVATVE